MATVSLPCTAVLIDLDGTLVDCAPDIVEAANRMLADLGSPALPFGTVAGFIGRGVPNLVRRVLETAQLAPRVDATDAVAMFHRHYADTNGRLGSVFPGVEAGLAALRRQGYRLACVTNKPRALAVPLLALTGLSQYLEVLVAGDSIAQMKPDPEPLRHACNLLDVDAAQGVLVGDSAVDVAAARAAGIPVCLVRYGYAGPGGPAALGADALVDSLEALPALLTPARLAPAA
ncbi:phosphoglycolate phosphatase (plasmid) [Cupriavidus necator H16]|uniref:Phosphoglycolate phosphatase, plasmid n=2 Tax=Cupriavidus necator (strain ATCC 17699 / DSM 428 / KCTC 22496 / NCIMB 10442 / H16 / Stanier 337) TaxID=381666 RepID=GPHP_CUPNH|nr:phosphoglycolate phosphatase [Cupriavidus necator]P40853.2 RecName: Full=Phosphoglycolate phosphatase, plasmid; Short=PGP; Short=PGPase [Cupriavidus necator H16]AAP86168.1 phosphoglycolate phosphatase [Cupriavidus necator H16]QCC05632.1 phosphoglycolate phosphatase [Cupriavidus necator H16]QQB81453.1 phosphoglycolate phosphatase [Cupriavidus necator]